VIFFFSNFLIFILVFNIKQKIIFSYFYKQRKSLKVQKKNCIELKKKLKQNNVQMARREFEYSLYRIKVLNKNPNHKNGTTRTKHQVCCDDQEFLTFQITIR